MKNNDICHTFYNIRLHNKMSLMDMVSATRGSTAVIAWRDRVISHCAVLTEDSWIQRTTAALWCFPQLTSLSGAERAAAANSLTSPLSWTQHLGSVVMARRRERCSDMIGSDGQDRALPLWSRILPSNGQRTRTFSAQYLLVTAGDVSRWHFKRPLKESGTSTESQHTVHLCVRYSGYTSVCRSWTDHLIRWKTESMLAKNATRCVSDE